MLDAVAPLSSLLDALNGEKVNVSVDQLAVAVETSLFQIGNASIQLSNLWWTKILEEYEKNLLALVDGKDSEFAAEAPMLFRKSFPKKATDYPQQLKLLQKAKEKPQRLWFFGEAPPTARQGEKSWH